MNAESIRGTQRTPLATQAWGESTRRLNTLYLHVFHWPKDGKLIVGGVEGDVGRARLLAGGAPLHAERINLSDVAITVPAQAPDAADSVIVLDMIGDAGRRWRAPAFGHAGECAGRVRRKGIGGPALHRWQSAARVCVRVDAAGAIGRVAIAGERSARIRGMGAL